MLPAARRRGGARRCKSDVGGDEKRISAPERSAALAEQLSAEDVAILRLESPRIAGHTIKVLTVAPATAGARLGIEALRAHVAARLFRVPRLKQRLDDLDRTPSWRDDTDFDIRNHVVSWDLPRPADRAEMLAIVGRLMEGRLDRSRPLWSLHLVALDEMHDALVLRLHHSMADGAAAVRLCSQLLWEASAATTPEGAAAHHVAPQHAVDLRGWVRRELLPAAADTPLDRHPSTRRRIATTRADLAELKRIGRSSGADATVNDVVLCAVAGGLRRWLEHHGGPLRGIRIKIPVSLHDQHESSNALGNRDSFLFVDVGADEPDPVTRLRGIAAQTRERKQRHDAQSLDALFRQLRQVSGRAAQVLSHWATNPRVFTANVSNVPGPRAAVTVLGAPVRDLFSIAEIADRHALRVAVISLADEVSFGLCADAAAVEDPEIIAAGIDADLRALAGA